MTATSALARDPLIQAIAEGDCEDIVERMNRGCQCVSLDHARLKTELERDPRDGALLATINATRPHLFADSVAFVAERHLDAAAALVEAVEHVVSLPGWQSAVLEHAPASARVDCAASGVFLGFDFHLGADGPRLIEINTNAGGGLLNVALARAQRACCAEVVPLAARGEEDPERAFLEMFISEWRAVRGNAPLRTVAIVDRDPQSQYLLPEFLLFQRLFERHGLKAWICDPAALRFVGGRLLLDGEEVDLVYNRLTDFSLDEPVSAALSDAWHAQASVITPHPRAHALYADKGNLALLCDDGFLQSLGIDAATRSVLVAGIPRTVRVRAEDADSLWKHRRELFFKPATGYGSRAAYRGDKLTRSVFASILAGDYIAQELVPPSARRLSVEGVATDLKMDLRVYAYRGAVQLAAARLYRGQTTNFRTPGGGFATVVALPCRARSAALELFFVSANGRRNTMIVFGIAGWSGSGKTTLIEKLIPGFNARGLAVSVIKHAHHGFDLDKPGKDSYRHREAGASQVLMLSNDRWVLMHELRGAPEPTLEEQLRVLSPCDVVLIEGFKAAPVPKVEVHRPAHGKPPLWQENPHVVAVAADAPLDCPLPLLPLNEPDDIVRFIIEYSSRHES